MPINDGFFRCLQRVPSSTKFVRVLAQIQSKLSYSLPLQRYENCECAKYRPDGELSEAPLLTVEGRCDEETPECTQQFTFYIITLTSMYCLAFLLQVAHILLPMRAVAKEDKALALGVFEGVCCLIGKSIRFRDLESVLRCLMLQ